MARPKSKPCGVMSMNQLSIQLGKKVTKIEKWKPEQFSLGVRALGNKVNSTRSTPPKRMRSI